MDLLPETRGWGQLVGPWLCWGLYTLSASLWGQQHLPLGVDIRADHL